MKSAPKIVQMRDKNGEEALEHLIQHLNKTVNTKEMVMVEIGSYAGESTVIFAKYFKKVYAIDPFIENYDPKDPTCHQAPMKDVYSVFLDRIKDFTNITHIRETSDDALSNIPDVDFVYIDGNHTYEQVKKDIENYLPKISEGFFIGGHDYIEAPHLGIKKAVTETIGEPDIVFKDYSWVKSLKSIQKEEKDRNNTIVLITPTGGREKQMQLCAKWMKAQTYKGNVIWIIVDDCIPQTAHFIKPDFKDKWTIIHHAPTPTWKFGENTQSRNIQAGLNQIPQDIDISAIFIIEDDDYYSPKYLKVMTLMLQNFDLCGEIKTIYYNVHFNIGRRCVNEKHSSLFQTAFKPTVIPHLEGILTRNAKFIDIDLFKAPVRINLFEGLDLAIGIKGMQGRAGIGTGHTIDSYPERIRRQSATLEELIGVDAKYYENL